MTLHQGCPSQQGTARAEEQERVSANKLESTEPSGFSREWAWQALPAELAAGRFLHGAVPCTFLVI